MDSCAVLACREVPWVVSRVAYKYTITNDRARQRTAYESKSPFISSPHPPVITLLSSVLCVQLKLANVFKYWIPLPSLLHRRPCTVFNFMTIISRTHLGVGVFQRSSN